MLKILHPQSKQLTGVKFLPPYPTLTQYHLYFIENLTAALVSKYKQAKCCPVSYFILVG